MKSTYFLAISLVAGCAVEPGEGDGGGQGRGLDDCALEEVARTVIEETVRVETTHTTWAPAEAEPNSVGWGQALLGSENSNIATASLMFECAEPTVYDPYCADAGGGDGVLACSRYACAEAGVHEVTAWFADAAHDGSLERHALEWDAVRLGGHTTAKSNPMVTWRADVRGVPEVWADAAHTVALELDDGTLDVSYELKTHARHGDVPTLDLELIFPGLSTDGPLTVTVVGAGEHLAGTIVAGGQSLGTISMDPTDPMGELHFSWEPRCDEGP